MAKVTLDAVKKAMEKSMRKDAMVAIDGDHVIIFVKPADLKTAAQEITKLDFDHLSCITGVDYPRGQVYATTFSKSDLKEMDESFAKPCFELIYELTSYEHGLFARLKTRIPRKKPVVPTVTDIWWNADWYERENYDLLGIEAEGHPDLRRLLLVDEFRGHPLRKDFQEDD